MITTVHARGTLVGAGVRRAYAADLGEPRPRLIAVWDDRADMAALEPSAVAGRYDTEPLAALLAAPVIASRRPPTRPVWRCTVQLEPAGPTLSQRQWADLAREVMACAGLAPRGDPHAVRWVAVGHGDRRVEIVATLARQDGRTVATPRDRLVCTTATRALTRCHQFGGHDRAPQQLPPDPRPRPALRTPEPSLRDRLRRDVRAAAIAATTDDEFVAQLGAGGLRVRLRRGRHGAVTGYAVSRPTEPHADPVWSGGAQLAPELALSHLRERWMQLGERIVLPSTDEQRELVWRSAVQAVTAATKPATNPDTALAAETAHAVADVLSATARAFAPPLSEDLGCAAELLHRCAGRQRGMSLSGPDSGPAALRALARLIAVMGQRSHDPPSATARHLMHVAAAFADNLGALREAQHRRALAAAARSAAHTLRAATAAASVHSSPHAKPPASRRPGRP